MVALEKYHPYGLILLLVVCVGCTPMLSKGMKADTMRAAIDECKQQNLNVLLYKRPDSSVFAIRCIPKSEEISKEVIVRPRMPVNMLRPFIQKETMVVADE